MDNAFKAQSLEDWKRLKELNVEERKKVLTNVATTLNQRMELSPNELECFKEYACGKLTLEQFRDIIQNLVGQFIKTNGEEESRRLLHEIILDALPS